MGSDSGLAEVSARVAAAVRTAGRDSADVKLIAVSKTFAAVEIEPVLRAGHRDFGENRVQEAVGKWPGLRAHFPDARLHLIGPLQTNKAADAVALFDAIHSLDRDRLATVLAKEMQRQGRSLALFVQVNAGEESQKAGVAPGAAVAFVRRCREDHGLTVHGLMCIPPAGDDPARYFSLLRRLGEEAETPCLSMGMSGDFEAAIAHGATHVRVGSAIFGSRE